MALRRPDGYTPLEAEQWDFVAPLLWRMRLLTEATRPLVVEGIRGLARQEELAFFLRDHDDTTEDEDGNPVHRPEYLEYERLTREMLDFSHNFGLTPLGRAEIGRRGGKHGTRKIDYEAEFPGEEE
jgi:hypothetical protein